MKNAMHSDAPLNEGTSAIWFFFTEHTEHGSVAKQKETVYRKKVFVSLFYFSIFQELVIAAKYKKFDAKALSWNQIK